MQAVVLAAGEGTRLRPLTEDKPKGMVEVAGKPILTHCFEQLVELGAEELLVVVGYKKQAIINHFEDEFEGVPITYAHQREQKGLAHALLTVEEHIDDDFMLMLGDNIFQANLEDVVNRQRESRADAAFLVEEVPWEEASRYGVCDTNKYGEITEVVEKPDDPPSNRVNVGAYVFPAEAREWLDVPKSERGEHELTDVLERVIETHDVRPVAIDRWLGVGRPWELLEANEWKLADLDRRVDGDVADSATLRGDVVVEAGATVEPGVVIEGPALVRAGAHVGPHAYVRGATLLGEDVRVGHAVEVKNSVVMRETAVPHLSYVGDSVLGRAVNFGAGTTVANLRHDDEPVRVTVKGERVSTGRRKFGVVVGDGAKTAIDTSLNAGVTLSTGARTRPGESVDRDR